MKVTLERLLADARSRVVPLRARRAALERAAAAAATPPAWRAAFDGPDLAVIAEVKRRSPSAGPIAPDLDPARHAAAYARGGARAVSVLTDPVHFGGSLEDLAAVVRAVSLPVLRKDFVVDPLQLLEARAVGAAAVLLIARAVPPPLLAELGREAAGLGLGALVEVHTVHEVAVALDAGATVIGVNARDLDSFRVDVAGVEAVLARVPAGIVAVAESGLETRADVERVAGWGADGILVGAGVARGPSPEQAVRALTAVARSGRPKGAS